MALLIVSGPWVASGMLLLTIELLGCLLGIVALLQMRPHLANILPLPSDDNRLITNGVYRIIRHPMYLALILVFAPLVVEKYNLLRLSVLIILAINLIFKLHYEERKLLVHYEGYRDYMKKSWRLIPYLY